MQGGACHRMGGERAGIEYENENEQQLGAVDGEAFLDHQPCQDEPGTQGIGDARCMQAAEEIRKAMNADTADDPKRYRTDKEVEQWQKRDPLPRFEKYLTKKGLLSKEGVAEIESELMRQIQTAVDRAEEKMKTIGDPMEMFEHAYAEMPSYLAEQKEEFERELAALDKEATDG